MIILKILGIILLVLLILLVIICLSSAVVYVSFWDGKFDWNIRYFGIKLLPRKKKSQKPSEKKEKKSDKTTEKSDENKKSDSDKKLKKLPADAFLTKLQNIVQKADMADSALNALPSALHWIGKALTWYAIETDIMIANEDAAKCAEQYGLMQIIFQNLLSQTGNFIHVKRKKIQLRCDFTEDKSLYQFRCRVKLHIGKTILVGISFLWNYFKDSSQAKKSIIREKL